MANLILNNDNLKDFVTNLKLNPEQESFLLDELPGLDEKERSELLTMLKDVYILNEEKNQAIEKIKNNWK